MSVHAPRAERSSAGLSGRVVVLTGAAGGLGSRIAAALRERGARLLLVDVAATPLAALSARLGCEALVADIATDEGRRLLIERCATPDLTADVLINNAGVERASAFADLREEEIRHALEVNLVSALLLTGALLPGMRERRQGHIISMASMAAIKPVPFNALYNTAKAGLVAFSLSLSKELAGSGVAATVVCPSAVAEVGMWARSRRGRGPNRLVDSSTVTPDDVVTAVLHALASQPRRVLVGSPVVRAGALLSAMSPGVDAATDRLSGIAAVYRERIRTDRDNAL